MPTIVQALIPPALHPALPGLVASHGSEAVLVLDERARILHESPSLVVLFGTPERPRLGARFSDLVIPEQRAAFEQALAQVIQQGAPNGIWTVVVRMQFGLDGLYRAVEVRLVDATSAEPPCWLAYVRPVPEAGLASLLTPLLNGEQSHTKGYLRRLLQAALQGMRASQVEFWRYSHSRDALVREMDVSAIGAIGPTPSGQPCFTLDGLSDYLEDLRDAAPVWLQPNSAAMRQRLKALQQPGTATTEPQVFTLDQPVWLQGRLHGLLSLRFQHSVPYLGPEQITFLAHVATLLALAFESARARALDKMAKSGSSVETAASTTFHAGDMDDVSEHSR